MGFQQRCFSFLKLAVLLFAHTCAAKTNRPHLILRGGDSPYELNPHYQPKTSVIMPPAAGNMNLDRHDQPPFLPHQFHVETTTHQQTFAPPQPSSPLFQDFQSFRANAERYLRQLYKNSPDLFALAASSVALFLLWQIPACHGFLQKNFICQRYNLKAGRFHVVLTSAVSHFNLFHLAFNLITLLNLGPQVKAALKTTSQWPLWPLLLGSALAGSMSQLAFGHRDGCLGLSGVTLGLFGVLARLYPQRIMSIRLFGIFPIRMASSMLLRVVLIWSVLGSFRTRSNIAHACHLGGIFFGLAFYEVWLRHRRMGAFWAGWKNSGWKV